MGNALKKIDIFHLLLDSKLKIDRKKSSFASASLKVRRATEDILRSSTLSSEADWRRGDSNPRPEMFQDKRLHA